MMTKAIRMCAEFMHQCLRIGWAKADLDWLQDLWWKYHGPNSEVLKRSE